MVQMLHIWLTLVYVTFVCATAVHRSGTCAIRGNCGKKSFFGAELPCAYNGEAIELTAQEQDLLVDICGESWAGVSSTCCDLAQLQNLKTNLLKADPLISSCPACRENFYQMFCRFTCSPDQSLFVNVTATGTSLSGQPIVAELDQYVADEFGAGFYDSCKNVKFSATNGYAMDLIGGGATNYKDFLKFLGDEKPMLGGSPFQINFRYPSDGEVPYDVSNGTVYACNDPVYKCACSDCPSSCPTLKEVTPPQSCKVGVLPCVSFTVIIIYSVLLLLFVVVHIRVFLRKVKARSTTDLLQDDTETFSNDDDSLDDDEIYLSKSYSLNDWLEGHFSKLGLYCALYPKTVIASAFAVTLFLSAFVPLIRFEQNPVNLWVSPSADAYKQKLVFDEKFGPMYRIQQIFLSNTSGSVVEYDTLKWWFEVEKNITTFSVTSGDMTITLDDLCFKPTGDYCVIESFTQYFSGDLDSFSEETWEKDLKDCADTPVNCLPPFQQPLKKELLFGGSPTSNVLDSKSVVITVLLNNYNNDSAPELDYAQMWEHKLERYLLKVRAEAESKGLSLSFSTEISLEGELNKSTNTDIKIVVISYLVMFAYASFALSGNGLSLDSGISNLVYSRISLGLLGIVIVLLSVSSAAGFWSIFGLKSTLIIAEVIPFLVLAVGVDNIFLISHEFENFNSAFPSESIPEKVARTMGKIGPSIMLAASSQFLCFFLASVVSMPAVRNFALYSAVAVLLNALLQVTCFVSVLSLDQKRVMENRLDIFPFIKVKRTSAIALPEDEADGSLTELIRESGGNAFSRFMKNCYTPILLKDKVRNLVLMVFVIWFGFSLAWIPEIQLGLDQRIAIPTGSYLIDYFNDIYNYLDVGPPVYFVVQDLDITQRVNQQKVCGRFSTCEEFSLINILEQERKRPEVSSIIEPTASWIDDFLLWLNPQLSDCCRFKKNTNQTQTCPSWAPARQCEVCYEDREWDIAMSGFPEGDEFMKFFKIWIESPSDPCPLAGKAPYSSSVNSNSTSIDSYVFRTSHRPLKSQDDFIKAYKDSLRLSLEINDSLGAEHVFAYSPFYIFFVQYETIVKLTYTLMCIALTIILCVATVFLGTFKAAALMILTVVFILTDIAGVMALWGISLNAVSLVNLMICIGLSVEFCTHITRSFVISDQTTLVRLRPKSADPYNKVGRAAQALETIGGSVLGGITLTKLIGVSVLAFTRSKIFEIYYFRMWLALVLIASLHSLVFLPVLLSCWGGAGYAFSPFASNVSQELVSRLRSAHREEYTEDET